MSDQREDPDDPIALLREVLARVDSGFRDAAASSAKLEKRVDEAHAGVAMSLQGISALQESVDRTASTARDLANGLVMISTQLSQLREGVASQVRHEVLKSRDDESSIADLRERATKQ